MTTKRAYKLQEFVAHSSSVNCLKIGKNSSRILVTGGEDYQVKLWAIGKPNAILSFSGHTSGIDSVSFDSSEVLVAAGAASGTIKLWDLEEAKIVRTLTGHRSNCICLDFHPFGEFFASGSLDTNLKVWDIRKKGCIHMYKGHTRGVNAIRFSPDGRWIISGGEDNTLKLWDLTAGKLLHDFKCHEGKVQCIDFHPHEFLLATGSADKTVKFWDLETFGLLGSAGPETTGVRCLTFNPDGRTLLCGLHENLKVFSWEPIRCHYAVDVGWSRLSDLNIHEGKLLDCSHNQSCVGRIEPCAVTNDTRLNGHSESKSSTSGNLSILNENNAQASGVRLPVAQNAYCLHKETKSLGRSNMKLEQAVESRKECGVSGRTMPFSLQSKAIDFQKFPNIRDEADKPLVSVLPEFIGFKAVDLGNGANRNIFPSVRSSIQGVFAVEKSRKDDGLIGSRKQDMNSMMDPVASYKHENDAWGHKVSRDACLIESQKGGRMRSLVVNWDAKERSSTCQEPTSSIPHGTISAAKMLPTNVFQQRGYLPSAEKEMVSASDEDAIAGVMEQHGQFVSSMQSRSAKYWEKSDVKTVISAMAKMADNAVVADVISIMTLNIDVVTLDICTCLLPLLTGLLESDIDRHLSISLDMLLKVVRIFGSVIYSTLSASSSVGVDIEAEQRLERCNLCFIELEKVKRSLPALTRTRVSVTKSAQELNLALQEVS